MPTNNPDVATMLDRIPKMMASHSVVANEFGSFQRLYTLSPVSKHFVRNEDGVSLAPMIASPHDKVFFVLPFFPFFIYLAHYMTTLALPASEFVMKC